MTLEDTVHDQRRHGVVNGTAFGQHVAERIALAEPEVGPAAPRRTEARLVTAVAEMEGNRHVRLGDPRPNGIVLLVAERAARSVRTGHRRRTNVDHPRAAVEQRFDFGRRSVRVGEREHRSGDDATPVVEAPVVLEPSIERCDARHGRADVVAQRFLDTATERREQQRCAETLLVHHRDALVAVLVLRPQRFDLHERPGVDVRASYGGVVAVDGVALELIRGTIVGLIGPNGAGKTTLLDAISGFTAYSGEVVLEQRDLGGVSPHNRVRAGLGRTFQQTQLYDDLSVVENVVVGTAAARGRDASSTTDTLELLGLLDVAECPVGELSQGRRQLVSIARALIGNPDVLLLDEPAGGLDSAESQWLGARLRRIRDRGVTILLIDHDMHLVLNLCDTLYVLDFGHVIAHGPPSAIKIDRTVAEAYLGSTHAEVATPA